ncbi:MAG: hypothetical protein WCG78_00135 [Candidatus Omnitrophota bacterium]
MVQEKQNKGEVLMSTTMETTCPVEPKSHKVAILVILGFIVWACVIVYAIYASTR